MSGGQNMQTVKDTLERMLADYDAERKRTDGRTDICNEQAKRMLAEGALLADRVQSLITAIDKDAERRARVPGFYVADRYARTLSAALIAGPYATAAECERERASINIAADCENVHLDADGLVTDADGRPIGSHAGPGSLGIIEPRGAEQ
jgi:hypothetical protein